MDLSLGNWEPKTSWASDFVCHSFCLLPVFFHTFQDLANGSISSSSFQLNLLPSSSKVATSRHNVSQFTTSLPKSSQVVKSRQKLVQVKKCHQKASQFDKSHQNLSKVKTSCIKSLSCYILIQLVTSVCKSLSQLFTSSHDLCKFSQAASSCFKYLLVISS